MIKPGLRSRVRQVIVCLYLPDLIQETVLGIVEAFLKFLLARAFHELVRVLVRTKIDDLAGESRAVQNTDVPHRGLDTGTVTVVGKQHCRNIAL